MSEHANNVGSSGRIAWVAGASGLVGRHLLTQLAQDQTYTRIIALVRRPLDTGSPKIECRVVDFDRLDAANMGHVDDAFCTLGTTIKKAGSQPAFYQVDFTYIVAFAKAARKHGATRFCLVSSAGANAKSRGFYLRVKGETENAVEKLGFATAHIFRPSFLEGDRAEVRPGERLILPLFRVLNAVLPRRIRSVPAEAVARAMIAAAKDTERGWRIHESDAIQTFRQPS